MTYRLTALSIALAFAGAAHAQGMPSGPPMHPDGDADDRAVMAARAASRDKALHDVLEIRPDQEQAFSAFTAAMQPRRDSDDRHDGMERKDGDAGMTTPERLDHMAKMMDERSARMRDGFARNAAAIRGLYAVLSPEQRRAFDALPMLTGHGGMGMHHMDRD